MTDSACRTIAFVDDDRDLLAAATQSIELAGYDALPFTNAEQALASVTRDFAGIVISDIRMPGMDGLELHQRIAAIDPDIPVILITGHGDVALAVRAIKTGAYDFITKPYSGDYLMSSIERALEKRQLVLENRRLRQLAVPGPSEWPLLGISDSMEQLREAMAQISATNVDVLVQGETGTGKSLVAKALHQNSPRARRKLVVVDCGALQGNRFGAELFGHETGAFEGARFARSGGIERANHGTLLLDQVELLPEAVQQKLIGAFDNLSITPVGGDRSISVDVRYIATSRADLAGLAAAQSFQPSLLYRLNSVTLHLKPLRERREDIPVLFQIFAREIAAESGRDVPKISADIWRHLNRHDWPGNVRELRHFTHNIVLGLHESLAPGGGAAQSATDGLRSQVAAYEASLIRDALAEARGSVKQALETLRIPRKTFYDKASKYGIGIDEFRNGS
ncbi:MAG: sigma-54 dependent transcriptional regulator [Blastomonas sp.]